MFTGNGKVSVISRYGKINPYKKVAKRALLVKALTELDGKDKCIT